MDYGSLPNDPDNPIGSSPWQSSPQPNSRQFSASEASTAPSSPLAKHSSQTADSSLEIEREDGNEEQRAESGEGRRLFDGEPIVQPAVNGHAQRTTDDAQHLSQADRVQQQHRQQPRQPSQQQRAIPNRYHGGAARQPQRQNLPQYKLQAKITSLERTGRKDPVLKFDVHVSSLSHSERKIALED